MAPVVVKPEKVREFVDAEHCHAQLARHHGTEDGLWIKIHKVGSGLPSISAKQAIDVVLCRGWVDAIGKALDVTRFLQRWTPRGKKSIWRWVNVDNIARLTQEGRMTAHRLAQVDAAKADGRWQRACGRGRARKIEGIAAMLQRGETPCPQGKKWAASESTVTQSTALRCWPELGPSWARPGHTRSR